MGTQCDSATLPDAVSPFSRYINTGGKANKCHCFMSRREGCIAKDKSEDLPAIHIIQSTGLWTIETSCING